MFLTRGIFVFICLYCVFINSSIIVCQSFQEDRCTTANGQTGKCLNIRQCPPVIAILNNAPKPLPQSTRQMLVALNCGFEQRDPKVCCVLSNDDRVPTRRPAPLITTNPPLQKRDPAQSTSYYSEAPPSVEGHPNVRLLPSNCGVERPQREIFGGNKTRIFELPWMTLLAYTTSNGQKFKCGGAIISSKYILTAAHCLTNLKGDVLSGVRIGEHDISKEIDCEKDNDPDTCAPPYQDLTIEEVITHPNYRGITGRGKLNRHQDDIGLIRVSSTIDLSGARTKAICLPLQQQNLHRQLNDEKLWVSGWGLTEEYRPSSYLLKVELPYFPNDQCARLLNSTIGDGIGFRQFCAGGEEGKDSCGGDSGGPLQVQQFDTTLRYYQYGIVSFGSRNCGRYGVPGVYTRVTHYLRWILDVIRP